MVQKHRSQRFRHEVEKSDWYPYGDTKDRVERRVVGEPHLVEPYELIYVDSRSYRPHAEFDRVSPVTMQDPGHFEELVVRLV